jgi:hypothetical protein
MFKKPKKKIEDQVDAGKAFDSPQPIDPNALETEWSPNQTIYPIPIELEPEPPAGSQFGDPVAVKTEWWPADSEGASPSIYKLDKTDLNRKEYKTKSKGLGLYIVALGLFMSFIPVIKYPSGKILVGSTEIALWIGCFVGIVVGCFFYFGSDHIVFDKYKGIFWKGFILGKWKKVEKSFKLGDIYALQIVDAWYGERSSYMVYQLNIVLKNGNRFNVFEDRKLKKIQEASNIISKFLGKPVWDATQ